jgi:hypothetical protein
VIPRQPGGDGSIATAPGEPAGRLSTASGSATTARAATRSVAPSPFASTSTRTSPARQRIARTCVRSLISTSAGSSRPAIHRTIAP